MKRHYAILGLILTAVFLVGCAPAASTPAPSQIPAASPGSTTPTPGKTPDVVEECLPTRLMMDELAASLPFEQIVLTHLAYGDESSLVIWMVSPIIALPTRKQNQSAAEQQAFQVARTLMDASPCLAAFDTLQFLVVDAEYRLWFSGSMRTIDLPNLQPEQAGGGTEAEQGGGREDLAVNTPPAGGPNTCTWPEAAQRLQEEFSTQQIEASFYFVRDAGGNSVYAQWSVPDRQAALNIMDRVAEISSQITCLTPPSTGISVLLTLPDGQSLLTGYQPMSKGQVFDPASFTFNFIEQP